MTDARPRPGRRFTLAGREVSASVTAPAGLTASTTIPRRRPPCIAFHPLGGVLPGARRVVDEPAVRATADATGATPSQVGLAGLLHGSSNVLLIPGPAGSRCAATS